MEDMALAMLLDSDSEFEEDSESQGDFESEEDSKENSDYDLLNILALAHDMISDSPYLNRRTRGSAGRLLIEEAIAEYLKYPDVHWQEHWESCGGGSVAV